MTQPNKAKHHRDGLLRVTGQNVEIIETALQVGIDEGRALIQGCMSEQDMLRLVLDHPDSFPESLVEAAEKYWDALDVLAAVTQGIVADHQSALCSTIRRPI